jgi:hypothetical protein
MSKLAELELDTDLEEETVDVLRMYGLDSAAARRAAHVVLDSLSI